MEPSPRRPLPKRRGAPSPAKSRAADCRSLLYANKKHDHKISPASFHKNGQQGWICPIEKHLAQSVGGYAGQGKRLSSNQRRFMKVLDQRRDTASVDNFNEVAAAVAAVLDSADEERALNISATCADLGHNSQYHVARERAHSRHNRAASEAAALAAEAEAAKAKAVAAVAVAQHRLQLAKAVAVRNGVRAQKLKARQVAQRRKHRKGPHSWKSGCAPKWARKEDESLRQIMALRRGTAETVNAVDWKGVALQLHRYGIFRTDTQCQQRWEKILRPGLVKGPWTPAEDRIVINYVARRGVHNVKWSEIANAIDGRIGKQCRERWFNHLDPTLNKGRWTQEEDDILFTAQERVGNKWSKIAELLPGRAENDVKNRFNSSAKKKWKVLQARRVPHRRLAAAETAACDPPLKRTPAPASSGMKQLYGEQGPSLGPSGFVGFRPRFTNAGPAGAGEATEEDVLHCKTSRPNSSSSVGSIAPYMWMQIYAANAYMAAAAAVAARDKKRGAVPGGSSNHIWPESSDDNAPTSASSSVCATKPRLYTRGDTRVDSRMRQVCHWGGGTQMNSTHLARKRSQPAKKSRGVDSVARKAAHMPALPFPAPFPMHVSPRYGSTPPGIAPTWGIPAALNGASVAHISRASGNSAAHAPGYHQALNKSNGQVRNCSGDDVDLDDGAIELAMELPSPGSALSSGFERIASPNVISTVSPCGLSGTRKPAVATCFAGGDLVSAPSTRGGGDIGSQMCLLFGDGHCGVEGIPSTTQGTAIDAFFQLDSVVEADGCSSIFPAATHTLSESVNVIGGNAPIDDNCSDNNLVNEMVENLPRPLMMMSIDDAPDGDIVGDEIVATLGL